MRMRQALLGAAAALVVGGCGRPPDRPPGADGPASIHVMSAAFEEGQPIPAEFTCDGANVSPPLAWSGAPGSAGSLALVVDDPDAPAGTWTHWVVYNLRPTLTELPRGAAAAGLPEGAAQARNDFGDAGYGGPCPPVGPHRYRFTVYALKGELALPAGTDHREVRKALEGQVVAQGVLTGTYKRK